jgi:diguanylate cyclase (GGDEF)-like protein
MTTPTRSSTPHREVDLRLAGQAPSLQTYRAQLRAATVWLYAASMVVILSWLALSGPHPQGTAVAAVVVSGLPALLLIHRLPWGRWHPDWFLTVAFLACTQIGLLMRLGVPDAQAIFFFVITISALYNAAFYTLATLALVVAADLLASPRVTAGSAIYLAVLAACMVLISRLFVTLRRLYQSLAEKETAARNRARELDLLYRLSELAAHHPDRGRLPRAAADLLVPALAELFPGSPPPEVSIRLSSTPGPPEEDARGLPLVSEDGSEGVLRLRLPPDRGLTPEQDAFLRAVGRTLGALVRTARLQERMAFLADHDPLTGLLNHGSFQRRLEQEVDHARAPGGRLSLLMLDVDLFKQINDTCGHPCGDQVLAELGPLLAAQCGPENCARYGGDEFAVLLPGLDLPRARAVAQKLREAVAAHPFGILPPMTVSIGAACLRPDRPAATLLDEADRALYAAKLDGRDRVRDLSVPCS